MRNLLTTTIVVIFTTIVIANWAIQLLVLVEWYHYYFG